MDNQHQTPSSSPERPSFFSIPAGLRGWSQVGGQFWGGILLGLAIGFIIAAGLAEYELITAQRPWGSYGWLRGPALAFLVFGVSIARRGLPRSGQTKTAGPPTHG